MDESYDIMISKNLPKNVSPEVKLSLLQHAIVKLSSNSFVFQTFLFLFQFLWFFQMNFFFIRLLHLVLFYFKVYIDGDLY